MKGLVFTEFLEMVAARFSEDMVDDIIEAANLPSGGAYTSVGTYPHSEMVMLVQQLSNQTGLAMPTLIKAFGQYLFGRFVFLYPHFFCKLHSAFDFLESIENYVHIEVHKLYPDAELPTFETQRDDARRTLVMTYRSKHPFAALAEGLIEGCLAHYHEPAEIQIVDKSVEATQCVEFHIKRI